MDYSIIGWTLFGVKGRRVGKSIYNPEYERFRELLRRCREKRGITQDDLAVRLGWTQTQISKCERGERRLDMVETRDWVRALGMTLPGFVSLLEKELGGKRRR